MTQTRAATAALSLRAKEELVRLLYGHGKGNGHDAHRRMLDHAIYSYTDLKKAYLQRVQLLHPDKVQHENNTKLRDKTASPDDVTSNTSKTSTTKGTAASEFIALQEAWEKYSTMAKFILQTDRLDNKDMESNFTMFGVGCSFSDSEAERQIRNEIMDQASKGWFPAGAVTSGDESRNSSDANRSSQQNQSNHKPLSLHDRIKQYSNNIPLIQQDDFIAITTNEHPEQLYQQQRQFANASMENKNDSTDDPKQYSRRRPSSLVEHLIPQNRR